MIHQAVDRELSAVKPPKISSTQVKVNYVCSECNQGASTSGVSGKVAPDRVSEKRMAATYPLKEERYKDAWVAKYFRVTEGRESGLIFDEIRI